MAVGRLLKGILMSLNSMRIVVTLGLAAVLGTTAVQAQAHRATPSAALSAQAGRSAGVLQPVYVQAERLTPVRYQPAHASPTRHLRAGDRLTQRELARAVKLDWRRQGLRAPARDQQWLRVGKQRVLVTRGTSRVMRLG